MINIKKVTFYKNSNFILAFILVVFFLKGALLVSAFPIFGGQDESRHYNTIQFLSEPAEKTWPVEIQTDKQNKDDISTYRYSDEIKNASLSTDTDVLRGEMFNTIAFTNNYSGENENLINQKLWQPINRIVPPDMVFGTQIYHQIGSLIEKAFSSQSILFRFYLIRIFSVLLGMLVILLSYLIAKTIGFSSKHALLLTAIISFQPKFSMYFAGINYDVLLIPMFVLFTWAGLLALKQGLNWKNLFLMLFSIVVAVLTKSTGYILAIPFAFLLTYLLFEKVRTKNKMIQYFSYILSFVAFVGLAFILKNHLPSQGNSIGQILNSISNYLNKSLSIGRFGLSSRTYWGTLGWTNNWFMDNVTNLIWLIQAFSLAGLGIFFFGKGEKPSYLPEKKYVAFLIGMIIALQLGIRTADWSIFSQTGSLDLGTPGRYFLPNLPAHIILVFVGLGMLFAHFKKEKYLDYSLLAGLILMFAFSMYLIFDVIIFRFYL